MAEVCVGAGGLSAPATTMSVMGEREHDAHGPASSVTTDGSGEVPALNPDMGGVWEVRTRTSVHIWDLDRNTYTRLPGPGGTSMRGDGEAHPIDSVSTWPQVGTCSLVFFSDPEVPTLVEHWRRSGTCLSIRATTSPGTRGTSGESHP